MTKLVAPRIALLAIAAAFFASACATETLSTGVTAPSVKAPSSDIIVTGSRDAAGNVVVCIDPTSPAGNYGVATTKVSGPSTGTNVFDTPLTITLPGSGCDTVFTRTAFTPECFYDGQVHPGQVCDAPQTEVKAIVTPPAGVVPTGLDCILDAGTNTPTDCVEPDGGVAEGIVFANFFHGTQATFSFAPAQGGLPLFVIGDVELHSIGTNVNFWGSQWWKNNFMSGPVSNGIAGSFKGYATEGGTCGQNWTSRVGNSPPPPATIGEYVGIIVTTTIQKNGPNITGDILQILTVKVDPGYGPNPGHWGTGNVVSVQCTRQQSAP